VEVQPIVVPPGQGHRVGNVEFLARTVDTPRFTFGIIEIALAGRCVLPPVRMLNIHAPAGFDRRIGLTD
jgi:hypothetical protein